MRDKKGHRVLAVKEFQSKDYEDVLKRPVFCSKQGHQKEELKYYCKECETVLCQTCFALDHGGHVLKLIEEEAESQKLEINTVLQTKREGLSAKLNVLAQLDEDCAKVIQQSEIAKRDVQRFADSLIKTIQAKMQNLIATVENQTKRSLESLKAKGSEIQHQVNVTESSLEEADNLLKRSTAAEVVQLKKLLQTIFHRVDQTEPIVYDPSSLQTFVFVENKKMLDIVNGEEIGVLEDAFQTKASESLAEGEGLKEGIVARKSQFNLITRNAERKQCYDERDRVTVEMKKEQERECVTEVRIDDNKNGIYKVTYYPRVNRTFKLLVKVNGEHISCSPFTVIVKPFQAKPVLSFGKGGSGEGEFNYPHGVAVSDGDEIVVTDYANHRVKVFDSNDTGNKLIKIFTPDGRFVMKIGEQGSFSFPAHCVQCGEYFIVSDSYEHYIKVFNREGHFQYKFGKEGKGDGEFDCPRFLSVTQSKHLLVCDEGGHRIQVFELNGKFVGKFGTNGSKLGEFNSPFSAAILSNEQIVVCERGNHRIQILQ